MLLAVALGPHRIGDYSTETDFYGAYADGARLIQHGHLDATRYGVIGPVYEVTLALAGLVVRDLFLAAELISVLAMTATLLLWFGLLRQRGGTRLALLAALSAAAQDQPRAKPLPGNKPCPYPTEAQKHYVAGLVRLVAQVRPDGTVESVDIPVVPLPGLGFEDTMRACVSEWRFEPAWPRPRLSPCRT